MAKKKKRYCAPCMKWVPANQTVCKACGADTDKALPTRKAQ